MGLHIPNGVRSNIKIIASFVAVLALVAQPMYGLVANALSTTISISSVAQLCDAIKNQADGQTWSIASGQYGIGPANCTDIPVVNGNTNKYVPLTANNLTISGIGNPTIYGQGYTPNGDGGFDGDFIAITGDNVTVKNLTVMTKIYPNKAIEVRGANSTIENVHVRPNTLSTSDIDPSYYPEWSALYAGSIYYHNATGAHSLKNSTITNGAVSLRSENATFNLDGLKLNYRTNDDFLNTYRIYKPHASTVVTGTPTYTYEVSHALNNIQSALNAVGKPDTVAGNETIKLISDLWATEQITITKPNLTIDGKKAAGGQYTIFGNFNKTDTSNNSILGIQANGVRINQLNINGQNRQLHGVNVYEATGVVLTDVSLRNNAHAGMIVGKNAGVTVHNITTSGNGWYGINVDKKDGTSSTLTVTGVSTHDEDATAHIYIDDRAATGNIVNDPGLQYVRYWKGNGYQYLLDRSAPTVTSTIAAENPTEFSVHATDDQRLIRIDYSIWDKDRTVQIGVWGQNIDGHVRDFNKTLTEYRVGTTPEYKPLTDLPDGEYQLNVTVGDVRGKSTNATVAYFKVGDFTTPTVPITPPDPTDPVPPINPDPSSPVTPPSGTGSGQGANNNSEEVATPTVINPRTITPLAQIFTPQSVAQSTDTTQNTTEDTNRNNNTATNLRTVESEENEDGSVLSAEDTKETWSLVNLLLTIGIAIASVLALFGLSRGKKGARVLTLIPAMSAIIALLVVEDFSANMGIVNVWSWLIGALAIAQVIILASTRTKTEQ